MGLTLAEGLIAGNQSVGVNSSMSERISLGPNPSATPQGTKGREQGLGGFLPAFFFNSVC